MIIRDLVCSLRSTSREGCLGSSRPVSFENLETLNTKKDNIATGVVAEDPSGGFSTISEVDGKPNSPQRAPCLGAPGNPELGFPRNTSSEGLSPRIRWLICT